MRIIGGGQLSKHGTPLHSGKGSALVSNTFIIRNTSGDNQHVLNIDGSETINGAITSTSTINATSTITTNGVVKVKEQASADGSTTDYGQLWIKTATPNELYFTTDAGNDIQVTSGTAGAWASLGSPWTTTGSDIYYNTGNVGVGMTSGISEKLYITGNISATGDITSSASDERLKENIKPINNAVEKVKQIKGITFDWINNIEEIVGSPWNDTTERHTGVLAQDVQKILPEVVRHAPFDVDEHKKSKSGKDYLTVKYEHLVPLLIEAIKEQQLQIDELIQAKE